MDEIMTYKQLQNVLLSHASLSSSPRIPTSSSCVYPRAFPTFPGISKFLESYRGVTLVVRVLFLNMPDNMKFSETGIVQKYF